MNKHRVEKYLHSFRIEFPLEGKVTIFFPERQLSSVGKAHFFFFIHPSTVDQVKVSFESEGKENSFFHEVKHPNVDSYAYAGPKNPNQVGCAQVNETYHQNDSSIVFIEYPDGRRYYWRTAQTMNDYLNRVGDIGCCTDFAFLLKAIFDEAEIPARRLNIPGHWLVEVALGTKRYVLDPSYGAIIDASLSEILAGKPRTIYLAPTRNIHQVNQYLVNLTVAMGFPSFSQPFSMSEVVSYF